VIEEAITHMEEVARIAAIELLCRQGETLEGIDIYGQLFKHSYYIVEQVNIA